MRTAVFSIISPNYRHYARVLMDSLRTHHPTWERFVLVTGGRGAEDDFTTVPLEELPLPHARQFCFRYTLLELNTAVKPWMFEYLFARGYDRVIYLDPDIVVYSPLAELDALPPETFLVLTPHLTGSIPGDANHPSERTILLAGTYNLGFLAVMRQPELARFLAWWQEKLEYRCVVDPANGLFVDQRWMDLAPGLFSNVTVLRHDGYNVAYWNLGQRALAGHTVNGVPLRFFHFSGFSPGSPGMLSKHYAGRTIDNALFTEYAAALETAGYRASRNAPYDYALFRDGTRIPDAARIAYRNSPDLQAAAGDDPFAHPELFAGLRDHARGALASRTLAHTYTFLSRARPLVRLMPRSLRTSMREFLLGRRERM